MAIHSVELGLKGLAAAGGSRISPRKCLGTLRHRLFRDMRRFCIRTSLTR
jgi:hypothetical protein